MSRNKKESVYGCELQVACCGLCMVIIAHEVNTTSILSQHTE